MSRFNNKGFTLIELLVATLIILVASLGLIKGIIEYEKFSIRGKMKTRATQILENMVSEIAKYPYPENNNPSILYSYYWTDGSCNENCTDSSNCCEFENDDSDNDGIPDFYDPYTGEPSIYTPLANLNSSFRLKPASDIPESVCICVGNNCPNNNLPLCVYSGYSGRNIYAAVNVAGIKSAGIKSAGRFASVVVWYFEPFTDKLQQMSAVIFKSTKVIE